MDTKHLLITDTGSVWPVCRAALSRRFADLPYRRDVATQAIRLGYVFVGLWANGAKIALRPDLVAQPAVARLDGLLMSHHAVRVALSCDGLMSSWEMIASSEIAIIRIGELIDVARRPTPRTLRHDNRLPLDRAEDIAGGRLLPLLQIWGQRHGRWDPSFPARLADAGLARLAIVTRRPRRSTELPIEHWGEGLTLHNREWPRLARGRDIRELPNRDVGEWLAFDVTQNFIEGCPRLRASTVVTRNADYSLVRVDFCYLSLPWRDSDGSMLWLSTLGIRRTSVLERPGRLN
jgi:hypothetical protein